MVFVIVVRSSFTAVRSYNESTGLENTFLFLTFLEVRNLKWISLGLLKWGSNQGIGRTLLHLAAPGENPRSHLLQLPGAPASLAQGPPSLFKASRGVSSDFSLHLTCFSQISISLITGTL